jgi:hypothetical protein
MHTVHYGVGYSHMDGRQNFVTRIRFIDSVTMVVTTIITTIKLLWKRNNSLLVGRNLINSGSSDAMSSWSFDLIPVTYTSIVL